MGTSSQRLTERSAAPLSRRVENNLSAPRAPSDAWLPRVHAYDGEHVVESRVKRASALVAAIFGLAGTMVGSASACTCLPLPPGATHGAPFVAAADSADLVVRVQVVDHVGRRHTKRRIPEAMRVSVLDVYRGKETRRTLRVRGDTGVLCRPYVVDFPRGTEWVLALSRAPEKHGEYALFSCNENWLLIDGDVVRGYIHPDPAQTNPVVEIPVEGLRSLLDR